MDNSRNRKGKIHQTMRSLDECTYEHKHTETWNIWAITDAFLDQKRVNVYEHAVKMASCDAFLPHVHMHLLSSNRERNMWLPKYFKFPCVCVRVYFHLEISFFGEFSLSFPIYWVYLETVRVKVNVHFNPSLPTSLLHTMPYYITCQYYVVVVTRLCLN